MYVCMYVCMCSCTEYHAGVRYSISCASPGRRTITVECRVEIHLHKKIKEIRKMLVI